MNVRTIIAKILNRLKLLPYLSFNVPVIFNNSRYSIPVIQGTGFYHLYSMMDHDFLVYQYFADEIQKGTFLDVGANIGQTIIKVHSLDHNNRIISVEPNANCVVYLYALQQKNALDRLSIVPAALFDQPGIKKLYFTNSTDTGASLEKEQRSDFFSDRSYFLVNAIDAEALMRVDDQRISFIKVDVEGAELSVLHVLQSLIDIHKPIIYCEVLDAHNEELRAKNNELKNELFSFITKTINYKIFIFDAGSGTFSEVLSFPDRVYSAGNLDLCNYVLRPA